MRAFSDRLGRFSRSSSFPDGVGLGCAGAADEGAAGVVVVGHRGHPISDDL